jgi:myosin-crossreactive antigen
MFSFQPWHSGAEMRRYLLRFIHLFPTIADLSGIYHTRYNQYHSMVLPIQKWLRERGVKFENETRITDMAFRASSDRYRVATLKVLRKGEESEIALNENDLVIITNGSMTDASTLGSMTAPAVLDRGEPGSAWALWNRLAAGRQGFGRPGVHQRHRQIEMAVVHRDDAASPDAAALRKSDPQHAWAGGALQAQRIDAAIGPETGQKKAGEAGGRLRQHEKTVRHRHR